MQTFYNTNLEEQESVINVDYSAKSVKVYTCRTSVYKRLEKKLGAPTRIYYTKGLISGAEWDVDFNDKKRVGYIFSRPTIIGGLQNRNYKSKTLDFH